MRAIVPGNPEESDLIRRITTDDKDEVMPPPKAKKSLLTKDEIAILRRWIEQGAEYEGHWAFQPLRDEAPPIADCGLRIGRNASQRAAPSFESGRHCLRAG